MLNRPYLVCHLVESLPHRKQGKGDTEPMAERYPSIATELAAFGNFGARQSRATRTQVGHHIGLGGTIELPHCL
jgi:hypothetical protein